MYRINILAVDPYTIQSEIYMASQLYEYFWKYKNKIVSDSNFYGDIFLPYSLCWLVRSLCWLVTYSFVKK